MAGAGHALVDLEHLAGKAGPGVGVGGAPRGRRQPGGRRGVGEDPADGGGERGGIAGVTSSPFTPSRTRSAVPPTRVATTGRPAAMASTNAELRSSYKLGSTSMSMLRSTAGT